MFGVTMQKNWSKMRSSHMICKEQLFDAKRFASAALDSLLDARGVAGPLARGEGL